MGYMQVNIIYHGGQGVEGREGRGGACRLCLLAALTTHSHPPRAPQQGMMLCHKQGHKAIILYHSNDFVPSLRVWLGLAYIVIFLLEFLLFFFVVLRFLPFFLTSLSLSHCFVVTDTHFYINLMPLSTDQVFTEACAAPQQLITNKHCSPVWHVKTS